MSRVFFRSSALILGLCTASAATAHHPPKMERCRSLTFTGQVEQIEWHNPHVELRIGTDGGESHRVTWLNIQGLKRAGIDLDTLRPGDPVTVTVGTRDDVVPTPMLLAAITRTSDDWEWSQLPQGC
jgi:hypothetical protein